MIFSGNYTRISNSVLPDNTTRNQRNFFFFLQVAADDPDDGINGEISFILAGGNEDGYFELDTSTGQISLKRVIPLGVNQLKNFVLWITAVDGKIRFQYRSIQLFLVMGFGFVFYLKECCQNRFPGIIFKIPYIFICSCLLKIRRKLVYSSKVIAATVVKVCFLLMLLHQICFLYGYGKNLQNNIHLTTSFNLIINLVLHSIQYRDSGTSQEFVTQSSVNGE